MHFHCSIGRSSLLVTLLGASVALAASGCALEVDPTPGDVTAGEAAEALAEGASLGDTTWSAVTPMNVSRRSHTATRLLDDRVLVVGGFTSLKALSSAEIYHPGTQTWTPVPPTSFPHAAPTATLLEDGRVLVAGDAGPPGTLAVEIYDPAANAWTSAHLAATVRTGHAAVRLADGRVLLAGGDGATGPLSNAYLFDPTTNAWSATGSLHSALDGLSLTRLTDGRVLAVGGSTYGGVAELFDPQTGTWTVTASPVLSRAGHAAELLQNGKVFVVGGNHQDQRTPEIFDPVTGTWSSAAPRTAHYDPTAVALYTGQVLTITRNIIELYDPPTDTWTLLDYPNLPHYGAHTLTLLHCGEVLATGGIKFHWSSSSSYASVLSGLDDTSCAAAGGAP